MKTRNLIFNALISAMICGSAFALSVDERKDFCESRPNKYVWVEKTQSCIPINPDLSSDPDIKYVYMHYGFYLPNDVNLLLNKYMEKHGGLSVLEIKKIDDTDDIYDYYAVKTTDGDYKVFRLYVLPDDFSPLFNTLEVYDLFPRWYVGRSNEVIDYGHEHITEYIGDTLYNSVISAANHVDEQWCRDAADFASLLADQLVKYEIVKVDKEARCKLMVPAK